MAKRFLDTDYFRAQFVRGLPAPYKGLYLYIICDCDYAGIWQPDFEVARLFLGYDKKHLNQEEAAELFAGKYQELQGGKWFFYEFVEQQHPKGLMPGNRAHDAVIKRLEKFKLIDQNTKIIKPVASPLPGGKEMERDIEQVKEIVIGKAKIDFAFFWAHYDKKVDKNLAQKLWDKLTFEKQSLAVHHIEKYKLSTPDKKYRKNPVTYIRHESWDDEIIISPDLQKKYKKWLQSEELKNIANEQ